MTDLDKIVEEPTNGEILREMALGAGKSIGHFTHAFCMAGYYSVKGALFSQTVSLLPRAWQQKLVPNEKERKIYYNINIFTQPFVTTAITATTLSSYTNLRLYDVFGISTCVAIGEVINSATRRLYFSEKENSGINRNYYQDVSGHVVPSLIYHSLDKLTYKTRSHLSESYDNAKQRAWEKKKKKLTAEQAQGALSLSERTETGNLAITETPGGLSYPENDQP